ncbi:MAG: bifunctional folylpolyglutamate synthase/dihydrofolate synthase [bacterium]|nr:bifunctional folylpolyglutamate synthase/dihydrofolate synthase [bacterium]
MISSYDQAIQYLYNLQPIGIKFGLRNTLSLLSYFDNPHLKIRTIHVAGTNGKGSICSMISSVLQAAGYRVGLYTSPHLVDFTERIMINGLPIPQSEVIRLSGEIRQAISDGDFQAGHPTFFEVVTVMALVYFAEQQVDFAVMETGMGGRLDATNVIQPLVGIITTIDFDHQEYLGHSLLEIAGEKAGIIKPGMAVVSGVQQSEIIQLLAKVCRQRNAELIQAPSVSPSVVRKVSQSLGGQEFEVIWPVSGSDALDGKSFWQRFFISLIGRHQIHNALIALTAIQTLSRRLSGQQQGGEISLSHITQGLACARWPGRAQVYPGSPPIMLDGAHNPAGARQLALLLEELEFSRLILVLGIMKDKDIGGICQELVPLADRVIVTRPRIDRAASGQEIINVLVSKALVADWKMVSVAATVPEAIIMARSMAEAGDLICLTGSLYTVGEAKGFLDALDAR